MTPPRVEAMRHGVARGWFLQFAHPFAAPPAETGQSGDYAYLNAFDGVTEVITASVSLNNAPLAYSNDYNIFLLENAQVVTPGATNHLKAKLAGKTDLDATVEMPADFVVNALPASVAKGGSVTASWSASVGATDGYQVWVTNAAGEQTFVAATAQTSLVVQGFEAVGPAYIAIAAVGKGSDRHLMARNQHGVTIQVTP